jgi:hypothetical protein
MKRISGSAKRVPQRLGEGLWTVRGTKRWVKTPVAIAPPPPPSFPPQEPFLGPKQYFNTVNPDGKYFWGKNGLEIKSTKPQWEVAPAAAVHPLMSAVATETVCPHPSPRCEV